MSLDGPSVRVPGVSPTEPEFEPYERVRDVENPNGTLVVVEVVRVRASALDLADGVTVADVHQQYPETDAVAVTAYERVLDRVEPKWPMWDPAGLRARLKDIDADIHLFPESRLERVWVANFTELVGDGVRCEGCGDVLESVPAWVTHLIGSCDGPDR